VAAALTPIMSDHVEVMRKNPFLFLKQLL